AFQLLFVRWITDSFFSVKPILRDGRQSPRSMARSRPDRNKTVVVRATLCQLLLIPSIHIRSYFFSTGSVTFPFYISVCIFGGLSGGEGDEGDEGGRGTKGLFADCVAEVWSNERVN